MQFKTRRSSDSPGAKNRGGLTGSTYQSIIRPKRKHVVRIALIIGVLALFLLLQRQRYAGTRSSVPVFAADEASDEPKSVQRLPRTTQAPLAKPPKTSKRANAAIVMLVRNSELDNAISSIKDHERTFNSKFEYPWIFFNDEPFTDEFKKSTSALTKAKTSYEIIPKEHWDIPETIDREVLADSFAKLEHDDVKYHHLLSYRQMCRWNSGFFFKHPALKDIKWYWRVEPEVHFFCDIDYDVFAFMEMHEKTYGFVISLYDSPKSIRTLWPTVEKFMSRHPEYLHANNSLHWLQDDARQHHHRIAHGYSTCHFWTNFEIANMEFWRSKPYQDFFAALDASGGFMYERWGDAPVHSIALGLMEDKHKIHFFDDIGYQHIPFFSCPVDRQCKGCDFELTDAPGTGLDNEDCKPVWFDNVERASKEALK